MEELKQIFLSGKRITAIDFLSLAQLSGYKLPKNAVKAINDKVDYITLLARYNNGASIISGYGLRSNTLLMIGREIKRVFEQIKAA